MKKANRRPLQRNNSISSVNITDRLGVRGRTRSRARLASRNRNNLTRTNSNQSLLQRSNSHTRFRGRFASRQPPKSQTRQNQTQLYSNSRIRTNNDAQSVQNHLIRQRMPSELSKGTSVIERLGVRRGGNTETQPNANGKNTLIYLGRFAKRHNSNVRNRILNGGTQQAAGQSSTG